jgi:hypothetical protein
MSMREYIPVEENRQHKQKWVYRRKKKASPIYVT